MKDVNSREKLVELISNYIKSTNPKNLEKIDDEIRHDNRIQYGDYMRILSGRAEVSQLSDAELYWLASAVMRTNKRLGTVEDYFEEAEIRNAKAYTADEKAEMKYPLVFSDCFELAEGQYCFPLTVGDIKALKSARMLQIIPELQRNHKKDKYGDLKTKVDKKTAQDIAGLIDSGNFFFNAVRFNLMEDEDSVAPVYDEETHTLTITGGTIIVPDGNHRTISCELATKHLNDKFVVLFTYLSAVKARTLLNQEWTQVPIPKQHKEAMKPTVSNKILDAILRSPEIDEIIPNNTVKVGEEIRTNDGFILYIELSKAIEDNYNTQEIKTKAEQDEIRDWLISFMNKLVQIMHDDFSHFADVKRKSWSVSTLVWKYYIMLSRVLRGRENWRDELTEILENTDFYDAEIKTAFSEYNRRKINAFVKEKEDEICTMLNRNPLS